MSSYRSRTATSTKYGPTSFSFCFSYVQALCHYLASDGEQLNLQKGKVLKVVDTLDADWLMCRYGNEEGKVHKACVEKTDNIN